MRNATFMRPVPLLAVSVATLLPLPATFAQEEAAPPPPPTVSEADAFVTMGYAMASQLRLNIGFSEEELAKVFEGMTLAAKGAPEPANFQEAIQLAQQIYMGRMQAFQEKENERIAAKAAENKAAAEAFFAGLDAKEGVVKTESGLRYEMLVEGTGKSPADTDRVKVNYKGTLIDGREFDANNDAEFMVNRVVPGFSEGLKLLKEGGKIKLYLPAELGYGDRPARPGSIIEPGSALVFEVDLLSVVEAPQPPAGPPPSLPPDLKTPPPPPTTPPPGPPPGPPPSTPPPPPPAAAGN